MDLRALADFVLVASHGGFAQAARSSGQSKATLSRRVRELEEDLGVRLFERGAQALRLTREGETLFGSARGPLDEVSEAEIALRENGSQPHGPLRISAPMLFSELAIGSIGAAYLKLYPAVTLELVAENRMASPIEEGLDLVICINPPPDSDLVGQCFLREHRQLVVAAELYEKLGPNPPSWPSITLVGNTDPIWRVERDGRMREIVHDPVMRVASIQTVCRAVLAGAGIGILPGFMATGHIESGRIVDLGEMAGAKVELWALHPSRRLASRKVTSFIDLLIASFPNKAWPAHGFS